MKQLVLSFLFFLTLISCFSQKLKDKFEYKVTYKLTYAQDSTALEESKSEYMVLFTGDELSKFSSRAVTLAKTYEIKGNTGTTSRQAVSEFHYQILKQAKTGKLFYTLKIPKMDDRFYYTEELDQFNWVILPETKSIKDFKVQKAKTSFKGRDYIAWFTSEIPISEGPFKFNGLPGLILEIADTDNHWNFEFIGLEKLTPKISYKTNLRIYAETERNELSALWKRYRSNPMTYAGQAANMDPEIHKEYKRIFTKKENSKNNPIELE
jgi:GLPGLI family protein